MGYTATAEAKIKANEVAKPPAGQHPEGTGEVMHKKLKQGHGREWRSGRLSRGEVEEPSDTMPAETGSKNEVGK